MRAPREYHALHIRQIAPCARALAAQPETEQRRDMTMGQVAKTLGIPMGVLIGLTTFACLAGAQDMRNMAMLTGAQGGTYHRFGTDVAAVIKKVCGADIEVRTSQGSLDNLGRLRNELFAQMAIVQQDALDYLRLNETRNATIKDWVDKFRYVLPLYREEVHIVARRDAGIETLADLAGKRVAVGEPGSGTNLTATLLLDGANLRGRLTEVTVGAREGILSLLEPPGATRLDAVFYVAGQPVPLLSGADDRIGSRQLAQLSLVAIPKNPIPKLYSAAKLTPAAYPWIDRTVETVAVRAVLIAYDFKGPQCDNVAMVSRQIVDNLDELQRIGHEKWRDVDLNAKVDGWERYACVTRRLQTPIEGCRFLGGDGEPGQQPGRPASSAADCRQLCEPRELRKNPLPCMLCQDKNELMSRRR
jgi:hypothetical protein